MAGLTKLKGVYPVKDEDLVKFYDLVDEIERLCRERGEMSLAEIEKMALAKGVRPTAILEELHLHDFDVRLSEGRVKGRLWQGLIPLNGELCDVSIN